MSTQLKHRQIREARNLSDKGTLTGLLVPESLRLKLFAGSANATPLFEP